MGADGPSSPPTHQVEVLALEGIPELHEGDYLATMIVERAELEDNDVLDLFQRFSQAAEQVRAGQIGRQ